MMKVRDIVFEVVWLKYDSPMICDAQNHRGFFSDLLTIKPFNPVLNSKRVYIFNIFRVTGKYYRCMQGFDSVFFNERAACCRLLRQEKSSVSKAGIVRNIYR